MCLPIPPPEQLKFSVVKNREKSLKMQEKFTASFLLIALFFLTSCSQFSGRDQTKLLPGSHAEGLVSQITPKWFKTDPRFSLTNYQDEIAVNYFWDTASSINLKERSLNVVISTPKGSSKLYNIDMSSGQRYFQSPLCSSEDITGKFLSTLSQSPVFMGIVPRVLDETGRPQKIIILGDENYLKQYWKTNFFEVKIIGGLIEKECTKRLCKDDKGLAQRLVLVAAQKGYAPYNQYSSITELKNKLDWKHIVAFLENQQGVDQVSDHFYSAYQITEELTAKRATEYLDKYSVKFDAKKIKDLKTSCYKLYDYWWSRINADHRVIIKGKTKQAASFAEVFTQLFHEYGERYYTCSQYVKPSNIVPSINRHWFFSYLTAFHHLALNGHEYSCSKRAWLYNPVVNNRRSTPYKKQLKSCTNRKLMPAFDGAMMLLKSLRDQHLTSYRYIDYDRNKYGGTHEKMYSWVPYKSRAIKCDKDDLSKVSTQLSIFPKDVQWDPAWVNLSVGSKGKKAYIK